MNVIDMGRRLMGRRLGAALPALMLLAAVADHAAADTLADALALAYQSNPTLQVQRSQQRILDETYVQARAGWRPTASFTGQAAWSRTDFGASNGPQLVSNGVGGYSTQTGSHYETNVGAGALNAVQPLYTGGRTAAAVRAAEAVVLAGREALRATEAQVLQSVITAYEDVRRDAAILEIREANAVVLRNQLEETQAKFDAGQVTRTDVAQAEAQLAGAQALLDTARAQLQVSRASYAAVVGQNPGQLSDEPVLPGLPPTVDQAFDTAEADNPSLRQAKITEEGSRARIAEAKAANLPTVSAQASFGYDGALAPFAARSYDRDLTGEIVVSQPIFTGGVNASNIRQALEQNTSDRISIEAARRTAVQSVSQAWNTLVGDRASVQAGEAQVRAGEVAFEGIREQYRVGLSTTLDVLIQQQTLEAAEVSLAQARHDAYVAEASLLAAMGRLQVADLVQGAPLYDPAKSFDKVKNSGATPWEPLIAALDSVGEPRAGAPRPIPTPAVPVGPVTMAPAADPIPSNAPLSTAPPTAPAMTPRG